MSNKYIWENKCFKKEVVDFQNRKEGLIKRMFYVKFEEHLKLMRALVSKVYEGFKFELKILSVETDVEKIQEGFHFLFS